MEQMLRTVDTTMKVAAFDNKKIHQMASLVSSIFEKCNFFLDRVERIITFRGRQSREVVRVQVGKQKYIGKGKDIKQILMYTTEVIRSGNHTVYSTLTTLW